ncbi:MAG: hypothetical protein P8179_17350 [Candidatus Thiodiazotropha sp.]
MSNILIAISLIILLLLGVAALFLAGYNQRSSSMDDSTEKDD